MPTVDKIVVELDAKINAYQSKIAKATVSYKTYGNTVQKTSKQAQSFMEKSQNGQALATERTARAIQRAQLLNSKNCLLYTSPSPRDQRGSRMPSSA